jgi:hypothetical protein
MDVMLIELLVWVGLLLFFWAMKDGLNDVESDIESMGWGRNPSCHSAQRRMQCCRPQSVMEPIGRYRGEPIYQYAVIDGRRYQFDRVWCGDGVGTVNDSERCVEPGLVYCECRVQPPYEADS